MAIHSQRRSNSPKKAPRHGEPPTGAARVVLAFRQPLEMRVFSETFRREGWETHPLHPEADLAEHVDMFRPKALVLSVEGVGGQSGWLWCRKFKWTYPGMKVILVDGDPTPRASRFAEFVGADRYVPAHSPLSAVRAASDLNVNPG